MKNAAANVEYVAKDWKTGRAIGQVASLLAGCQGKVQDTEYDH